MLHATSTSDTEEQVRAAVGLEPVAPAGDETVDPESGDGSGPSDKLTTDKTKPAPKANDSGESNDNANDDDDTDDEPDGDEDKTDDAVAAKAADGTDKTVPVKRKGGWQKRIDKVNRRNAQLEDDLRASHQQLMEVNRRLAEGIKPPVVTEAAKTEAAKTPTTLRARPDTDDPKYVTYNDYLKDNGNWIQEAIDFNKAEATRVAMDAVEKFKTESAAERQRAEDAVKVQRINEGWAKAQDDARAVHYDFDTVWTNNTDPRAVAAIQSPVIRRTIFTNPLGGHLAHWLGSNVDKFVAISQLSPDGPLLDLGKVLSVIETNLEVAKGNGKANGNGAAASTATVRKSGAPRPARTASGKSGSAVSGRFSVSQAGNLSMADYKAARAAGKV